MPLALAAVRLAHTPQDPRTTRFLSTCGCHVSRDCGLRNRAGRPGFCCTAASAPNYPAAATSAPL